MAEGQQGGTKQEHHSSSLSPFQFPSLFASSLSSTSLSMQNASRHHPHPDTKRKQQEKNNRAQRKEGKGVQGAEQGATRGETSGGGWEVGGARKRPYSLAPLPTALLSLRSGQAHTHTVTPISCEYQRAFVTFLSPMTNLPSSLSHTHPHYLTCPVLHTLTLLLSFVFPPFPLPRTCAFIRGVLTLRGRRNPPSYSSGR